MDDRILRENVVELLLGGHAHATPEQALAGLSPALLGRAPGTGGHSCWDLLEHLRLAQEDILRYTLDPAWKSPPFPKGYWPPPGEQPSEARWSASVSAFLRDLGEVAAFVKDPRTDLTARLPHGEGRTYLRQALLVADHNAYHLGQIVEVRRALRDWPQGSGTAQFFASFRLKSITQCFVQVLPPSSERLFSACVGVVRPTVSHLLRYTSVLKYLRPESAISVTTLASGPSRSATRIAATTFAPEDVPAKRASSRASRMSMGCLAHGSVIIAWAWRVEPA